MPFQKGRSGNPLGRPKRYDREADKMLFEAVTLLRDQALQGDFRAREAIYVLLGTVCDIIDKLNNQPKDNDHDF